MKKTIAVAFISLAFFGIGVVAARADENAESVKFLASTDVALTPGGDTVSLGLVNAGVAQDITLDVEGSDQSAFRVRTGAETDASAGTCPTGGTAHQTPRRSSQVLSLPVCLHDVARGEIVTVELSATAQASTSGVLVAVGAFDGSVAGRNIAAQAAAATSVAAPAKVMISLTSPSGCFTFNDWSVSGNVEAAAGGPNHTATVVIGDSPVSPICDAAKSASPAGAASTSSTSTTTATPAPAQTPPTAESAPQRTYVSVSGVNHVGTYVANVDLNGTADGGALEIDVQRSLSAWLCILLLAIGAALASAIALVQGPVCGAKRAVDDENGLRTRLTSAQKRADKALSDAGFADDVRPGWNAKPGPIWDSVSHLPNQRAALFADAADLPGGTTFEAARAGVVAYETAIETLDHILKAYEKLVEIAPGTVYANAVNGFVRRGAGPAANGFETAPGDLAKVADAVGDTTNVLHHIDTLEPAVDASTLPAEKKQSLKAALHATKDKAVANAAPATAPPQSAWTTISSTASALVAAPAAPAQEHAILPIAPVVPPRPTQKIADVVAQSKAAASRARLISTTLAVAAAVVSSVVAIGIGLTQTYYSGATWGTLPDIIKALVWAFSLSGGLQVAGYVGATAASAAKSS